VLPFLNSFDPRLRRNATLTVGSLRATSAVSALLAMAYEDTSPLVRPAAIEALAQVGDERLIPRLLPLVDDTNAYLRAALAHTLCMLDGQTPEVQHALHKLSQDQVEHVAFAARRALRTSERKHKKTPAEAVTGSQPSPKPVSWFKRLFGRA